MVDVASVVIAVISLVGTVIAVLVGAYFTWLSDERKRRRESEALIAKYRDPLLLAAQDLQSRLHNITDWTITAYFRQEGRKRENLVLYTAFMVGQYLSWTYILRRQLQFLRFSTEQANKRLAKAVADVSEEFSTDKYGPSGAPFMLWRGDQLAIGEVMTIKDGDQLFPMGYAAFRKKWAEDRKLPAGGQPSTGFATLEVDDNGDDDASILQSPTVDITSREIPLEGTRDGLDYWDGEFRNWFHSVVDAIIVIARAKTPDLTGSGGPARLIPDQRLRRLQHLIIDLIDILDPKHLRSDSIKVQRCHRAEVCECSVCYKTERCRCEDCKKVPSGPTEV